MWNYPEEYDLIVVGAGHAGCEAAFVASVMGAKTLLLTINLDTIAKMSCNPAIGGTAKGHIVREIDALGGIMGKIADQTAIQYRMLNASKGPAVWAPRAQADKLAYQTAMKQRLENQNNLCIKQGTIERLLVEKNRIQGVATLEGVHYRGKTVILSSGTFMRGTLFIGEIQHPGGRAGDPPSTGLSAHLEALGFSLGRLKTGTPPRIHGRSIDFSQLEMQPGEEGVCFSHDPVEKKLPQVPCFITYTSEKTKAIILENLHRSPMYSGKIVGIGPRYCPSIEDKVVRFKDKERHQIFLEPEGLSTEEFYVNGISSSLPFDAQFAMIHSVIGLENAEIMRPAYAIEYDYVKSGQLYASLETKEIEGLFFAGQINGTTGYEEAAAQGLIAGINAANKVAARPPFLLTRSEAYIGVMIDDLISKEAVTEPYRMFTSRAEHRLLLRQDNADLRLRSKGHALGLIDEKQHQALLNKQQEIATGTTLLSNTYKSIEGKSCSLAQLLCRPEYSYPKLRELFPQEVPCFGKEVNLQIEIQLKYAGYISRQAKEAEKLDRLDVIAISTDFNFSTVNGLGTEAKEKLNQFRPYNLGQASRLSGISPADITVLMVALKKSRS